MSMGHEIIQAKLVTREQADAMLESAVGRCVPRARSGLRASLAAWARLCREAFCDYLGHPVAGPRRPYGVGAGGGRCPRCGRDVPGGGR